jgi:hypothetical protein
VIKSVKSFKLVIPEYNCDIAFISPEDSTRWVIGWMDGLVAREEGGASYEITELTYWFELPPAP